MCWGSSADAQASPPGSGYPCPLRQAAIGGVLRPRSWGSRRSGPFCHSPPPHTHTGLLACKVSGRRWGHVPTPWSTLGLGSGPGPRARGLRGCCRGGRGCRRRGRSFLRPAGPCGVGTAGLRQLLQSPCGGPSLRGARGVGVPGPSAASAAGSAGAAAPCRPRFRCVAALVARSLRQQRGPTWRIRLSKVMEAT